MCVDFTDLNKACPKDPYPLPNIDRLIDGAAGYKMLSFTDAYSGYNQIKMNPTDAPHTTFMTNTRNYFYNVMPFGLKNVGATYQRLMDRVFSEQIGKNLEVYIDDMVVKTTETGEHDQDLSDILAFVRKYNMRLNPTKCSFGVQSGKFLGFMLTNRGIEANPENSEQPWTLSVDGASNIRGSGAGVVLEGPDGVLIEQSLRFAFKASNNQAEYEALLAGMKLAKEMDITDLKAKRDSQLVTNQVSREFQVKDP
jgi:hypothetical protein